MAADGGCERDVTHRMNEGYTSWGVLKSLLSNRGLGIKVKKCLYERVIVPTALYGAETWGMRSAKGRKLNILEMNCLRSLVVVSRIETLKTLKTFIATVCQYNTIQYNVIFLQNVYKINFFLFLKDCKSKHVGPIVSYKGF